jgi:hypothetical protein
VCGGGGGGLVSFTLKEEHRLKVLENRVLRRIFRPKGEEVSGGWMILRSEELQILLQNSGRKPERLKVGVDTSIIL